VVSLAPNALGLWRHTVPFGSASLGVVGTQDGSPLVLFLQKIFLIFLFSLLGRELTTANAPPHTGTSSSQRQLGQSDGHIGHGHGKVTAAAMAEWMAMSRRVFSSGSPPPYPPYQDPRQLDEEQQRRYLRDEDELREFYDKHKNKTRGRDDWTKTRKPINGFTPGIPQNTMAYLRPAFADKKYTPLDLRGAGWFSYIFNMGFLRIGALFITAVLLARILYAYISMITESEQHDYDQDYDNAVKEDQKPLVPVAGDDVAAATTAAATAVVDGSASNNNSATSTSSLLRSSASTAQLVQLQTTRALAEQLPHVFNTLETSSSSSSSSQSSQSSQSPSPSNEQMLRETRALEEEIKAKREEVGTRYSALSPLLRMGYGMASALALLRATLTWPYTLYTKDSLDVTSDVPLAKSFHDRYVELLRESSPYEQEASHNAPMRPLLPPVTHQPPFGKPITLLINTEVLIAPTFLPGQGYVMVKRPAIDHFITRIAPYAEVVFQAPDYPPAAALSLCHSLDPYGVHSHCLDRTMTWRLKNRNAFYLDENKLGRSQDRLVVLDRDYARCDTNCSNVLMVSAFHGARNDRALMDIIPFIQYLSGAAAEGRDVRDVVSRYKGLTIDTALRYINEHDVQATSATTSSSTTAQQLRELLAARRNEQLQLEQQHQQQ
jgi:hypothetical protein